MNEIDIVSRYLYSTLTDLLDIPIYNGETYHTPTESTFCKFWVLDGLPVKFVDNQTAWTEFSVSINVWSNEFKYIQLGDIIDTFDGVQGVEVIGDTEEDKGYIQSIIYDRQYKLRDNVDTNYFGVGCSFKVRVKNN